MGKKGKVRTMIVARKKRTGLPPGMNLAEFMSYKKQIVEEIKEEAKSEYQRVLADRQTQRGMWMMMLALSDTFDFTPEMLERLDVETGKISDEYAENRESGDQDYADEKLRRAVSQRIGRDIPYLYEDEYPVNIDRPEAVECLREAEDRIY